MRDMTTTEQQDPALARSREELAAMTAAGARPKWLMFWGHRPQRDGSAGAGSLSQWWPAPFLVDGVRYATAEHWMMAGKARLFGDEASVPPILGARTPAEAKSLGRLVRGFDDERWRTERFELVVRGNVARFGQDPALREYLLGTRNRVLVEASPRDRVWGIGFGAAHEHATVPERWRGLNLLGFALMEARERLARQ
ncbi:NADAR family protein [Streptacidiphilus sp. PB12-B1b]|uniref:NADAR family protein n=1 Tax=Streptacidiphilus sp. PB12-B1b TaxID=2705012 RepID=UPI0015FA08F8|nr:NADAR family protein [Streptacidiphilus sp. PB12-B1b]QMU75602.1 NADAR family protein [Streptacidiphilus sp. PB12-B1b]